jgi:hypothetical protein
MTRTEAEEILRLAHGAGDFSITAERLEAAIIVLNRYEEPPWDEKLVIKNSIGQNVLL